MASGYKVVQNIQGDGAPSNGDPLCTNLALFPIGTIYTDSETGIVYVRNAANGVAADWVSNSSGGSSYLVYVALLSQSGTDAPTAQVLENTLGGTPVWNYDGVGEYSAFLEGVFNDNKTVVLIEQPIGRILVGAGISTDYVSITVYDLTSVNFPKSNDGLYLTSIEIRVYP